MFDVCQYGVLSKTLELNNQQIPKVIKITPE